MNRFCLFLVASALSFASIDSALAQKTWDGGAGTNQWTDGDNWNPNGVPSPSDDVLLAVEGTVELNASTEIGGFTLRGQGLGTTLLIGSGHLLTTASFSTDFGTLALDGPGDVTTDSLAFTIGTLRGSGTLTVTGSALISGTSFARTLIGRTLRLEGPTVVAGGNPLRMGDGAVVEIAPGVLFDIQSDGDLIRTGTITTEPVIHNAGTLRKSLGTSTSLVRIPLTNAGTVEVETGTLQFGDGFGDSGGTSTGTFAVDAGATLDFGDGAFDLTTADFSGDGTVDFGRAGVLTLMGSYDLGTGTTKLSGNPGDTVTFDGAMSLVSLGTALEVGGSSTMNLEAMPGQMPATVALSSGGTLNHTPALTVQLLSLAGSSTFSGPGDVTTDSLSFTSGTLQGSGTMTVTGGALISGTSFARTLIGRTLRLEGPTVVAGGNPLRMGDAAVIEVGPGALFDIQSDGDLIRTGTITTEPVIHNAGTLRKSLGTGSTEVRVALANAGTVDAASGELRMESLLSNEGGGMVMGTGTLDLTDPAASFSNAGTFAPGASPGLLTFQGAFTMDASAVLEAEISGTTPGVDYDQLAVEGDAALDGTLRLADIVGGSVAIDDTFTILTATGTVSGTFDAVVPPFGYAVDLTYNPQSVVVTVTQVPNFDLIAANTTPLTVQPGGSVAFDYSISNNTTNAVTGNLWFVAERNGAPVAQGVIRSGTLPGGATISGSYTQAVPSSAPTGAYTYRLRIGQFPAPSVDEEVFTVTVVPTRAAGGAETWTVSDVSTWAQEPIAAGEGEAEAGSADSASSGSVPSEMMLAGAYPNPFSQRATVGFDLPETQRVTVAVYDVLGREVARLVDGEVAAGRHEAVLDGSGLPSGVYLVRMTSDTGFAETRRLTLLR